MARIRTIKPEFPHSESMGRVSRDARLLFILLWTLADDSGITRGSSRILASLLFPYDDDAKKIIDKWISELERENSVVRYVVEGHTYLQVLNWAKHQRIDKPTPSRLPPFDEASRVSLETSREVPNSSDGIRSGPGPVPGREGKGPTSIPESVNPDAFAMWIEYRKAERKPVKPHSYGALFKKFAKCGDHAAQLAAVENSIANNYQGLYPERAANGAAPDRPRKTRFELAKEELDRA